MYIKRSIEATIIRISKSVKVLLLTGARQVGKTTLLKHLDTDRTYVTLDDLAVRSLAVAESALFLQRYTPPVLIDEIQYAPQLLNYIKIYADTKGRNGDIWITGSQRFSLMKGVTESLAGRMGIVDLQGLSAAEIRGVEYESPFKPVHDQLFDRLKVSKPCSLKDLYNIIWKGSMPAMYNGGEQDWENYYSSYVQTFLQRDINAYVQTNDEMTFFRFLSATAFQTGKIVNYAELAKAAEISAVTAKQWIKVLEAAGVVYLLQPLVPAGAKYAVKAPKLHFLDTGLAAYLTRWNNADFLEQGVMSEAFFESWAVGTIYKSYSNAGRIPPLNYFRNFNSKEIELLIYENGIINPIKIQKNYYPEKAVKMLSIIEPLKEHMPDVTIGEGGIICLADDLLPAAEKVWFIPAWML